MGKWLSSILTALVILAATSFAGAILKGPIDEISNQDRLKAQIQLSPWLERPDTSGSNDRVENDDLESELLEIRKRFARAGSPSLFGLARVSIENNGTSIVKNINFRIGPTYKIDAVVEGDEYLESFLNTEKIYIPDMKPGDRFTVYMWGTFSTYSIVEDFKSYSSEGSFLTSFDWPKSQAFEYGSWISQLLDEYAWTTFVISVVILVFGFGILAAMHQEYIKVILTHKKAYRVERKRFLQDPKKFSPDMEITSQRHYQVHALFSNNRTSHLQGNPPEQDAKDGDDQQRTIDA